MITLKKLTLSLSVIALLSACHPQQETQAETKSAQATSSSSQEVDLTTDEAKLGYMIGTNMASQLEASELLSKIDVDALIAAFKDKAAGKDPRMTNEEMALAQQSFEQKIREEQNKLAEENRLKGEANKTKGVEYLVEHATQEGVLKTESGLQYEILREGKGDQPTADSTVKVHYSGKTIDGTEFDSSYERGTPTEFPVAGVIPGFSEGLQLMKTGAKYRLTIPSDQAYGLSAPPKIGPNQVLIFEVELIEIIK